jgi:hypothetical protein
MQVLYFIYPKIITLNYLKNFIMARYIKDTPRLKVKFINADTEATILELNDRTWLTIGELLSEHAVDAIIKSEIKDKELPENIMVLVVAEFTLQK